jgi:hypothetical protein
MRLLVLWPPAALRPGATSSQRKHADLTEQRQLVRHSMVRDDLTVFELLDVDLRDTK